MKVIVCRDKLEATREVADIIANIVKSKPSAVLGLATGATPEGVYALLADKCSAGEISFRDVRTYNLDEYVGLPESDINSYRYYMNYHLFDKVDIDKCNTHLPDSNRTDENGLLKYYDDMIDEEGGLDVQLLGVGVNGHIGFNEPEDRLYSYTHDTALTESTISVNSVYFTSNPMPTHAVTMGMGTIFKAKTIVLMATGRSKVDAVASLLSGRITTDYPVSLLNLHNDVIVVVDKDAMGE